MGGVAGDAGSAGGGLRVAIVLGGVLKVEVRLTGGHVLWVSSCETKGKERGGWCFWRTKSGQGRPSGGSAGMVYRETLKKSGVDESRHVSPDGRLSDFRRIA